MRFIARVASRFLVLVGLWIFCQAASAAPAFVQAKAATPQTPQTSVAVAFNAAQVAGNLNVVVVGWLSSTSTVLSVTDTSGNVYQLAAGPTVSAGNATQAIYYAAGIAAGTNTVTVSFSTAATFPDVRVAEYSGIAIANPVDVATSATGSSATSSSGVLTTTNASDLLVSGNIVETWTAGPGSGFTQRLLTDPNSDILQDRIVTTAGSYTATAPMGQSGYWIMQLVAFRAASGTTDTQAPSAPSGLAAVVISSSQINLSWTAATDNVGVTNYLVERCQGVSCSTFAQVGTPATIAFNSTGLSASTSYSYRVRATDAANNLSAYSGTASGTTQAGPSTQIAFVQANSATPQTSQSSIAVSYAGTQVAGNLNVVVVGWLNTTSSVQAVTDTRGNVYQLAVGPTTVASNTTQSIYYAAGIAAGSNTVTVTFSAAAPFPDVRIAEYSGISAGSPVDVVKAASGTGALSDSGAVTTTYANDLLVAANIVETWTTAPGTNFTKRLLTVPNADILEDRIVTATGSYNATALMGQSGAWIMQLVAFRGGGGGSGDTQVPTAPTGTAAAAISSSQINVTWSASTDNVGVTNYLIERCSGAGCSNFAQAGNSATTSFSNTGLNASTSYSYRVRATDAAGNLGAYSTTASATTPAIVDAQAPTAPTGLTSTAPTATQVNLAWSPSTDNVAVTGYLVERCQGAACSSFAQVGTTAGAPSFTDNGVIQATSYSYRVRAKDAANNMSSYSGTASVTTPTPDTQAPSAPSSLGATVISNSQINLSWGASIDNVGVTAYQIERCTGAGCSSFALVGTSATTSFISSGLSASTSYSYRVRARDAAGNLSAYSSTASSTTQAGSSAPLAFVQANSATPQSPKTSLAASFTAAQGAGNLNVVVIAWLNNTAHVQSVTDTRGNLYQLVAGPTTVAGEATQAMYYAAGIAAGSNTITVTFTAQAPFPDLRIAEYSGVDAIQPVDTAVEASGNNNMSSSGSTTTANLNDLLVAANVVETWTTGPGANFTKRVLTDPNADILEDRIVTSSGSYTATAPMGQAGWWIMQMVAFRSASGGVVDTVPPTTSVTAPANGANVFGTVTLSATASDPGSGVAGVQFQVDGVNVGGAVKNAPYSLSFDTSQFANGTHTVGVYAWDVQRNVSSVTTTTVTFINASPGNPAQTGLWSGSFAWPLVPIHMNLMYTGRILMWDGQVFGGFDAKVYDPVMSSFIDVPVTDNIFCGGHSTLPDGRILVTGGHADNHVGLNVANIFDPHNQSWTAAPPMAFTRWYPTNTPLADGRVLVMSGETNCDTCYVAVPEIYNPTTNSWSSLSSASLTVPYYPYMYQLPNGKVLAAGTAERPIVSKLLDLSTLSWSTVDPVAVAGGSAVMYRPGKILKTGQPADPDAPPSGSLKTAYVIDMTAASPAWRQVQSMAFSRTYHNLTELPDGNVLVTGGDTTAQPKDLANAVFEAELWSPTTETWTTLARMHVPRLYHSAALLLPDARVLVAGGGRWDGVPVSTDQLSAEVFAPPYLFKGPRPVITSAPTTISYGQIFSVPTPDAASIASVALIAPGNVTHTNDMNTRFVPLTFTASAGSLSVTAPANANLATPGYYMLFIVNSNGVPSVAKFVKL